MKGNLKTYLFFKILGKECPYGVLVSNKEVNRKMVSCSIDELLKEDGISSFKDRASLIGYSRDAMGIGGPYRLLYHNSLPDYEKNEFKAGFYELTRQW